MKKRLEGKKEKKKNPSPKGIRTQEYQIFWEADGALTQSSERLKKGQIKFWLNAK